MRMARALRHRGPDGFGLLLDEGAGLVSARLAIFDLPRGWQPLVRPAEGSALVYNGEVYNHPELRAELTCGRRACSRRPATPRSSTGSSSASDWLPWTASTASSHSPGGSRATGGSTLVRDRFGVRPLHYALLPDGTLVFGSEAKALFASGEVAAQPDLDGIDDVFTLWGVRPPRSAFAGIRQVPAGGVVVWERGRDRRRAALVDAQLRRGRSRARKTSRISCETACGSGCAPTFPSGHICPAASIRASSPRSRRRRRSRSCAPFRWPSGTAASTSAQSRSKWRPPSGRGTSSSRSGGARSPPPSPTLSITRRPP